MPVDFTFVPKHYTSKVDTQMADVLMDPKGTGPSTYYYMIRGGKDQKNITIWEPGTVSGEYIKSYGHYHLGDIEETYWMLFGQGVVLLQKMALDTNGNIIPDKVLEFKAITVKAGDKIDIPKGYGHVICNIDKIFLVSADNTDVIFDDKAPVKKSGSTDYESVKQMRGFAYYVIDNNGSPFLKKNDNYKGVFKADFGGLPLVA